MFSLFSTSAYGQLPFTPGLPDDFKGPFLEGSRPCYYSRELGLIVVQELTTDQFTLQYYFFYLLKKITLFRLLPQGLHSFLTHRGTAVWTTQKTVHLGRRAGKRKAGRHSAGNLFAGTAGGGRRGLSRPGAAVTQQCKNGHERSAFGRRRHSKNGAGNPFCPVRAVPASLVF